MGHFSMKIVPLPGSLLGANQHARYKKGRARAIGAIAQTLITKARAGDTIAMLFYLKTQGGWREADREPRLLEETEVAPIDFRVLPAVTELRVTRGSDS